MLGHVSICVYILVFSLHAILLQNVEYTEFSSLHIVFLAEFLKLIFVLVIELFYLKCSGHTCSREIVWVSGNSNLCLVLIAFCYSLYNILSFTNAKKSGAVLYTVLMNIRILLIPVLLYFMNDTKQSKNACLSLFLLFCGCSLASLAENPERADICFIALAKVLLQAFLSSFASVMNQLSVQNFSEVGGEDKIYLSLKKNRILYFYGAIFGLLWLFFLETSFWKPVVSILNSSSALLALASLVIGGLSASAILQYFSAVTKAYATAVEIALTCVFSSWLFDYQLTLQMSISITLILVSVMSYNSIKLSRAFIVSLCTIILTYSLMRIFAEPKLEQLDWKNVWHKKGKGPGNAHQQNGFSQLNETMWTKLVCTITNPIIPMVNKNTNIKILDAGCGSGAFILAAQKCNKIGFLIENVVGVDYSPSLIQRARVRFPSGRFFTSGIQSLPAIETASFDVVWSFSTFIYLSDENDSLKTINELFRLTKPGGTILIGDVADLDKKKNALELRAASHYYQTQQKFLNIDLQHLYLNKSLFRNFCQSKHCEVSIIDESNMEINFYEPAQYRYLVLIRKPLHK
jgi:ubiquinone/menaquinone biosynthesis C-methylase UbiE